MKGPDWLIALKNEPVITISGQRLTEAQAMTVRAALTAADFDCGGDPHGQRTQSLYLERKREVLDMMLDAPRPRPTQADREVYPGADARVSELERALKSCSTVLSQMLKKDEALAGVAREALAEADRALVVSDGNPHAGK